MVDFKDPRPKKDPKLKFNLLNYPKKKPIGLMRTKKGSPLSKKDFIPLDLRPTPAEESLRANLLDTKPIPTTLIPNQLPDRSTLPIGPKEPATPPPPLNSLEGLLQETMPGAKALRDIFTMGNPTPPLSDKVSVASPPTEPPPTLEELLDQLRKGVSTDDLVAGLMKGFKKPDYYSIIPTPTNKGLLEIKINNPFIDLPNKKPPQTK